MKRLDGMVDVLKSSEGERGDVLLVAVGPFASLALEIAERLDKQGHLGCRRRSAVGSAGRGFAG